MRNRCYRNHKRDEDFELGLAFAIRLGYTRSIFGLGYSADGLVVTVGATPQDV